MTKNSKIYLTVFIVILISFKEDKTNKLIGNWAFKYKFDVVKKEKICGPFQSVNQYIDFNLKISRDTLFAGINCESTGGKYIVDKEQIILKPDSKWLKTDMNCEEGQTCFNSIAVKKLFHRPFKYKLENDSTLLLYLDTKEYYTFIKF